MARLLDLYDASFNPDDVEASRQSEPIPDGDYVMHVSKTELNETRARNGYRLDVEFTIIEGQHENRKLFASMNVRNPNQQAETIALGELKRLSEACGVDFNGVMEDSDMLLFQPFLGYVAYKQDMVKNSLGQKEPKVNPETNMAYAPRNRVTRFNSVGSEAPPAAPTTKPAAPTQNRPQAAQQPAPRPAVVAGKANPFGRK